MASGPNLRLLVLTDLQGQLEPCGCTSDPKGGIDRTATQIASLSKDVPTLVLVTGDTLFDRQKRGPETRQQAIWQAEALADILKTIGVEAATPGGSDLRYGLDLFTDLARKTGFPWLVANAKHLEPFEATRAFERGGLRIGIVGVSDLAGGPDPIDPPVVRDPLEALKTASHTLRETSDLVIALVRGDRRIAREAASLPSIDFVLQSGLDREKAIAPSQSSHGWILHAGRQGQGLLVIDLFRDGEGVFQNASTWSFDEEQARVRSELEALEERIAQWKRDQARPEDIATQQARAVMMKKALGGTAPDATTMQGNRFSARYLVVDRGSAVNEAIREAMDVYFRRVNEHNREAFAERMPPPLNEGEAGFIGSVACASCHEEAFAWWKTTRHGRAYTTLQKREKEFNLDCVGCHLTGYERPGGSTVTHNENLLHVGCESCHGPGSLHRDAPPKHQLNAAPTSEVCFVCHTPEHSDQFNYDTYRARLRAPGHQLSTDSP